MIVTLLFGVGVCVLFHHILFYTILAVNWFRWKNPVFVSIFARNLVCGVYAGGMFYEGTRLLYKEPCCVYNTHVLTTSMLGYIIGDCVLMYEFPELNNSENRVHHALTTVLLVYSWFAPGQGYITLHFAGTGEFSTLFLCVADVFKNIPPLREEYGWLNTWSRVGFVVSFLSIRVLLWSYVLYSTVVENTYIKIFLCGLMLLQYYWGGLILKHSWKICHKKIVVPNPKIDLSK